jgi:DNA-binding NarL/FixJ family response regulator
VKPQLMNLLLVDDEPDVLEGLVRSLRHHPYQVVCAGSGAAALVQLAQTEFAALVADEQMPGMTGSELLTTVRRQYPRTARVLLTGRASVQVAVRCINDAAAARFLEKPCAPAVFCDAIAQAIQENVALVKARQPPTGRFPGTGDSGASAGAGSLGGFTGAQLASLSRREREVFDLMVSGQRISQIARRLFVSPHTVRNHVKAIFHKLDLHSQTQLLERSAEPS